MQKKRAEQRFEEGRQRSESGVVRAAKSSRTMTKPLKIRKKTGAHDSDDRTNRTSIRWSEIRKEKVMREEWLTRTERLETND